MLFSASLYASKNDLQKDAAALERLGIDFFHVDCKNDPSVFSDIQQLRKVSSTPVDLHVIAESPTTFFFNIETNKIEQVVFQWEDVSDKNGFIQEIKKLKTRKGIAFATATEIPGREVLDVFDFVLLMCTTPGESGGIFDSRNFERIIRLKQEYKHLSVHVDGGVNNEIAFVLRLLGVDLVVSGSYLMNHELLASGMLNLMRTPDSEAASKSITVKDFMIPAKYLPVLHSSEINLQKVLQIIEDYRQGFVLIQNGKLEGVITNADLRRGFLKNIHQLNSIEVNDFINSKPVTVHENTGLADLLKLIRHLNFIILFLPVVDDNHQLKGAILLNNLTRG